MGGKVKSATPNPDELNRRVSGITSINRIDYDALKDDIRRIFKSEKCNESLGTTAEERFCSMCKQLLPKLRKAVLEVACEPGVLGIPKAIALAKDVLGEGNQWLRIIPDSIDVRAEALRQAPDADSAQWPKVVKHLWKAGWSGGWIKLALIACLDSGLRTGPEDLHLDLVLKNAGFSREQIRSFEPDYMLPPYVDLVD